MLTLNLDQLTELYPEHIWLTIADSDRQAAARAEQHPYSHDTARARAYLNTLCLECLTRELPETLDRPDTIAPAADDLAKRWEFVTGFSVTIGDVPLVIIPTDTLTLDELRVPREWVDIPSWAAPYYVACQVDLEDGWLRIAGYATHKEIKAGDYDSVDFTYSLPISNLGDFHTIWHLREHCLDSQHQVDSLPELSDSVAESLIRHYSQPVLYSPRLLPVPEGGDCWLSLIANPNHLDQLHTYRTSAETETQNSVVSESLAEMQRRVLEVFGEGWRLLDDLINPPVFAVVTARGNAQAKRAQIPAAGRTITLNGQIFNLAIHYDSLDDETQEMSADIQVNSTEPQASLPVGLTLSIRDDQRNLIDGDRATPDQLDLKVKIIGSPGETYLAELALPATSELEPISGQFPSNLRQE